MIDVKQWLAERKGIEKEIEFLCERIEEIQRSDNYGDIDVLNNKLHRLRGTLTDLLAVVFAVEDEKYKKLLFLRYVKGLKWQQIANEMYYSIKSIQVIHKKALRAVEEALNAEN